MLKKKTSFKWWGIVFHTDDFLIKPYNIKDGAYRNLVTSINMQVSNASKVIFHIPFFFFYKRAATPRAERGFIKYGHVQEKK